MTQSPNSTDLAASLGIDPRARRLAEIAAECPIGTGLVSEAEISDFAAALTAEFYREREADFAVKARAAAQAEAPPEETNEGDNTAAGRRQRKPRQPGKPRRPSISTMIKQTEQAGKPLVTITLPDGTKLDFNKPEPAESENPWPLDEFRTKETKQ